MRPLAAFPGASDVVLQPRASKSSDLTAVNAAYAGEIASGQHLVIRMTPDEIRVPLSALEAVVNSTP